MSQPSVDDRRALLDRVRRRWMATRSMREYAQAAGAATLLLLLVLATDRWLRPGDLPMVLGAGLALGAALLYGGWRLWSLRRTPSDRQVARFIEERCPDLEDRLASATDVTQTGQQSALTALMLHDASTRARSVDPDHVVTRHTIRSSILRGVAATACLLTVFTIGNGQVGRLARTAWLYAFPYSASLTVLPGDARVVVGDPFVIVATVDGTIGAPSRTPPSVTLKGPDETVQSQAMEAHGSEYRLVVPSVDADFTYHVRAATLVSGDYAVTALQAPRVERIDVAYQYPDFANLPPRVELDSGDIYAPAGTAVTLTIHVDQAVETGTLRLESGTSLGLEPREARVLTASFTVSANDTYRVSVFDADGLTNPADIKYFIRTVVDQPPEVAITRPVGDLEITSLEEVAIEARAQDDFGLARFELVYAVVGEPEQAVRLLPRRGQRRVEGKTTIYAEDLGLQPGDFISYYARALDTNTGTTAGEVRTDIYFLQVRPFDQEFEEARSQSTASMDAGDVGRLADVQKEIIVATWKLEAQSRGPNRSRDLASVADAQEELRWATSRLAQRVLSRGVGSRPQALGSGTVEMEAMRRAVEAMTTAEIHLRAEDPDQAVAPEMDALNQLLKAEAEIRRRQVSRQTSNGSQQGGSAAREDLSALFDRELRRDQQTNYETPSTARDAAETPDSANRERLRKLAERQQALQREQQDLAETGPTLDPDELQRTLDRLTREQNALREQLEDLSRSLDRGGDQGRSADGETAEISRAMRQALSNLRRGDVSEASRRSREASERLQELEQELGGASATPSRAGLGELRLEAEGLAERQRQLAAEARGSSPGSAGRETREDLARRGERLADGIEGLHERLQAARSNAEASAGDALAAAERELRDEDLAAGTRELAERIRAADEESASAGSRTPLAEIADDADTLADSLDRVAQQLVVAGDQSARAQELAAELEGARQLRARLEQIQRQLGRLEGDDTASSAPGGSEAGAELAALQQQLAQTPELREELIRRRPSATEDLERWSRYWRSGPAPGTETFKQDLAEWESLRTDLQMALEDYVAGRSQSLRDEEIGERLHAGQSEQVPGQYRGVVDRYYRSIAEQPER